MTMFNSYVSHCQRVNPCKSHKIPLTTTICLILFLWFSYFLLGKPLYDTNDSTHHRRLPPGPLRCLGFPGGERPAALRPQRSGGVRATGGALARTMMVCIIYIIYNNNDNNNNNNHNHNNNNNHNHHHHHHNHNNIIYIYTYIQRYVISNLYYIGVIWVAHCRYELYHHCMMFDIVFHR